jgi:hypothetical protein
MKSKFKMYMEMAEGVKKDDTNEFLKKRVIGFLAGPVFAKFLIINKNNDLLDGKSKEVFLKELFEQKKSIIMTSIQYNITDLEKVTKKDEKYNDLLGNAINMKLLQDSIEKINNFKINDEIVNAIEAQTKKDYHEGDVKITEKDQQELKL